MVESFLLACTSFAWWIETTITSLLLFGEYPYPAEDDAE